MSISMPGSYCAGRVVVECKGRMEVPCNLEKKYRDCLEQEKNQGPQEVNFLSACMLRYEEP
jgi:hypothetical protein